MNPVSAFLLLSGPSSFQSIGLPVVIPDVDTPELEVQGPVTVIAEVDKVIQANQDAPEVEVVEDPVVVKVPGVIKIKTE